MTKNTSGKFFIYKSVSFLIALGALLALARTGYDTQNGNVSSYERNFRQIKVYSADTSSSDKFVFADEEDSDEGLTEEDLEEFSKYEKGIESHENVMSGNFETRRKAKGFGDIYDGKEDDIASQAILENVGRSINEAKKFHNMKQMLPDFKKTYQDLKDATEYHDKTVEYLYNSHECIIRYLTPHYKEPAGVWFGGDCGISDGKTMYCHYSPEKNVGNNSDGSKGMYDDVCPNDTDHLCYIIKIEENEYEHGIGGLLIDYYNKSKEEDALQETRVYLHEGENESPNVNVEKTSDNEYTSQVEIEGTADDEGIDKDIYVSNRDDQDAMDKDNVNAADAVPSAEDTRDDMKKEGDPQEADINQKDPKKAEALEEETRKSHLMNWIWGSQVATDISRDLDSKYPKFGKRIKRFPLWNDQKEFYDQYVDGKYENIRKYIKKAPMPDAIFSTALAINAVFGYETIIVKDEFGEEKARIDKSEISGEIATAMKGIDMKEFDVNDATKEAIDKVVADENAALAKLKAQHENKMAVLRAKKEKLQDLLAKANNDLSETNDKVNDDGDVVASSVNTDRITEENAKSNEEIEKRYKTPIETKDSPMNKKFSSEKEVSDTDKAAAKKDREAKTKLAETQEQRSKFLSDELKKVKEALERERREYVKEYAQLEEKLRKSFNAKVKELDVPLVLDSTVISRLTEAIAEASANLSARYDADISLPTDAATLAGEMIECLREEAGKLADKTKSAMDVLKENESIYYIATSDKVQNAHKDMITKMKNISTCDKGGVPSAPVAEKVFGTMCDEVACLELNNSKDAKGLTNYFVGAMPLQYDLKAPNPPVEFSSAPMREVFHFDLDDYENLEKYYEGENPDNNSDIYITADGFINSGLEMPLIWKYILRRHTFGHKQFNLVRLLGNREFGDDVRGDPDKNYIRSGSFPCYIGSNVIDVSGVYKLKFKGVWQFVVENFGYSVNNTKDIHIYNKVPCQGFSLRKGRVIDYAVDASPPGGLFVSDVKGLVSETSELGTVLAYVPDLDGDIQSILSPESGGIISARKLTFNASMQKAVGIVSATEDFDEDKEQEALFYLANRTFFDRNQFGDFLNQYEQEAMAREALIKVENQIQEIVKNLQDILSGTGVIITDDFDLLNEEDYKEAADALNEQKEIFMNKAEKEIQTVKGATQSTKEKVERLLHHIAVLEADSEEIVQVSGDEDLSDLAARIKNKQADNSVGEAYDDMGREAQERRIRQLQPAYCEVHTYK